MERNRDTRSSDMATDRSEILKHWREVAGKLANANRPMTLKLRQEAAQALWAAADVLDPPRELRVLADKVKHGD